jgi:hypothetical protein
MGSNSKLYNDRKIDFWNVEEIKFTVSLIRDRYETLDTRPRFHRFPQSIHRFPIQFQITSSR